MLIFIVSLKFIQRLFEESYGKVLNEEQEEVVSICRQHLYDGSERSSDPFDSHDPDHNYLDASTLYFPCNASSNNFTCQEGFLLFSGNVRSIRQIAGVANYVLCSFEEALNALEKLNKR